MFYSGKKSTSVSRNWVPSAPTRQTSFRLSHTGLDKFSSPLSTIRLFEELLSLLWFKKQNELRNGAFESEAKKENEVGGGVENKKKGSESRGIYS